MAANAQVFQRDKISTYFRMDNKGADRNYYISLFYNWTVYEILKVARVLHEQMYTQFRKDI